MYALPENVHTIPGDDMNSQELLSTLLKTTQAGQIEIRSILDGAMSPSLRSVLQSQLREYDDMETEALTLALQRGWDLKSLASGARFLTDRFTRIRRSRRDMDSKIAEVMIRKNTKAMISGLKYLHQYKGQDSQLCILAQKLLDCETAHIRRLQSYL